MRALRWVAAGALLYVAAVALAGRFLPEPEDDDQFPEEGVCRDCAGSGEVWEDSMLVLGIPGGLAPQLCHCPAGGRLLAEIQDR